MKGIIALFLLSLGFSLRAQAQDHCLAYKADLDECYVMIDLIHPSQVAVGEFAIRYKAGKIEKEYAENELDDHLKDEANPAVIGPDSRIYIIDGHHHHRALADANIPHRLKKSYIEVKADFRNKSRKEFESYMIEKKYVYLKDENFNDIAFDQLPDQVSSLKNNPYRSLAWLVRQRGGYNKSKTPFAEFLWGEFFKQQGVKLSPSDGPEEMEEALKRALELSSSPSAKNLPGFKG